MNWPLEFLRPVKETKVFGIIIANCYRHMLKRNWDTRFEKLEKILFSWNGRHLDSIYQRVEIVNTFAMSRIFYLASILPIPQGMVKRIEKSVGKFIWTASGKILRVQLDEMKLSAVKGGCRLVCVKRKAKSLLVTQLLRLLKSNDEKSIAYLGYWVGELLGDLLPGIETGNHCERPTEYFGYLASLIADVKIADQVSEEN